MFEWYDRPEHTTSDSNEEVCIVASTNGMFLVVKAFVSHLEDPGFDFLIKSTKKLILLVASLGKALNGILYI